MIFLPRHRRRRAEHARRGRAMRAVTGTYAENARGSAARCAPWLVLPMLFAVMVSSPAGSVEVEPITPIPRAEVDAPKAELGRKLFHDPRLSQTNTVACAS